MKITINLSEVDMKRMDYLKMLDEELFEGKESLEDAIKMAIFVAYDKQKRLYGGDRK